MGVGPLIAVFSIASAWAAATPAPAEAQQVHLTGPLAGQPAVRHMRVYRKGRFQVQPTLGFTLQDEFSRTMFAGVQANYHLTDWLGVGVWGAFGMAHIDTSLTDEVASKGQTTDRNVLSLPSADKFAEQIGLINWAVAAQATFIPLRGKLALFQSIFVDTDFYVFGGLAAVGVEERADVTDPAVCADVPPSDACLASQLQRTSRVAVAPTFGAGLMLYVSDFVGVTLEWRGLPFAWNTSGTDESGDGGDFPDGRIDSEDQIFHFNHMVNLGVAFYLPTEIELTD